MLSTKIVCTIGPASDSPEILEELADAGMNIARLNFSHGTYNSHKKIIKQIVPTVDMDSKTKRTFISYQGQPKGLPWGIKLIPGVGIHFRTLCNHGPSKYLHAHL